MQSTRDALARWIERLVAAEQIAATLQRGGEVAGYNRRRIDRERITVDARAQSIVAELARAMERLGAIAGTTFATSDTLQGALLPDDPRPLADLLASARERPALRSAALRADAWRHEEQAAARAWMPEVTIGAGIRHVDAGARSDSGIVLSVGVPLPLFDRSEGARQRAAAQAALTLAQLTMEREQIEGDVRGLWMHVA